MQKDALVAEESAVCDLNKNDVEDGEKEEEDEFEDAAGLEEDGTADHGEEHIEGEVLKHTTRHIMKHTTRHIMKHTTRHIMSDDKP